MDKKNMTNTLNEIRILCSIDHPYIVGYKEAFVDKSSNELNIVMEYVGGGDLSEKIKNCEKRKLYLNEKIIWRYFLQILQGLKCLHSMKIIHRDIKSANLFLSEDMETVKVGDLNIAKVAKDDLARTQIGTPYYLAPEVWNNEVYSYKCDIFSLGCVLYEMTCLKVPFQATSLEELAKNIKLGNFATIPSQYSSDLLSIIRLCLTTNSSIRPNAEELLANPIVQRMEAMLGIKDAVSSSKIDNLMETIKVDNSGISKNKFQLPSKKKYTPLSAEFDTSKNKNGIYLPERPNNVSPVNSSDINCKKIISRPTTYRIMPNQEIKIVNPGPKVPPQRVPIINISNVKNPQAALIKQKVNPPITIKRVSSKENPLNNPITSNRPSLVKNSPSKSINDDSVRKYSFNK